MLYEFCYIMALGGTLCISLAGLTFYINRPLFNRTVYKTAWKGINVYHDITAFMDRYKRDSGKKKNKSDEKTPSCLDGTISGDEDDDEDISVNNTILSYTDCDGNTMTTPYIPPIHDLLFVKRKIDDKTYCKRINGDVEDIANLEIVPIDKLFIQVELKQRGKSIDIHEHLQYFYVKNNHILDNVFLKWYLKYWYFLDLEDDYTLSIIDHNVKILKVKSCQSLLLTDGKYVIITNEDDELLETAAQQVIDNEKEKNK